MSSSRNYHKKRKLYAEGIPCTTIFTHPGREKSALHGNVRHINNNNDDDMLVVKNSLWGTSQADYRYQQENLGRFVTFDERSGHVNGESSARKVRYWAEWSGTALQVDSHSNSSKKQGYAHKLTDPATRAFTPILDVDVPNQNISITDNDPCVLFGFNYTLCRQHFRPDALVGLPVGSIILFTTANHQEFVLDTCFVVGASLQVSQVNEGDKERRKSIIIATAEEIATFAGVDRIRDSLKDNDVPNETRTAWNTALSDNNNNNDNNRTKDPHFLDFPTKASRGPHYQTMYQGATYQKPVNNGMFSFVPAIEAAPGSFSARPTIKLEKELCKNPNAQLLVLQETGEEGTRKIWNSVVDQCRQQGYKLVTWLAPPKPSTSTIITEAVIPFIKVAESDLGKVTIGSTLRVDLDDGKIWMDREQVWVVKEVLTGPKIVVAAAAEEGKKEKKKEEWRIIDLRDFTMSNALKKPLPLKKKVTTSTVDKKKTSI